MWIFVFCFYHFIYKKWKDCAMDELFHYLLFFWVKNDGNNRPMWNFFYPIHTQVNLANKTYSNKGRMNEMRSRVGTNGWAVTCFWLRACIFNKISWTLTLLAYSLCILIIILSQTHFWIIFFPFKIL